MNQMTRIPAAQQIQQLTQALNAAFIRKTDAQATIDAADKEIVAIRNVLGGVGIGQELQKEINAAAMKMEAEAPAK